MKQTVLTILALLCLLMSLTGTALAADVSYVMDDADLLTAEEETVLETHCAEAAAYGCGVYIVTVADFTDYGSYDPYEAAQNIYLERGLGVGEDTDGIMLMLSMADRDYSLIAHGYLGNAVFPNNVKDTIIDNFLDDFRYDDWNGGFTDYVNDCAYELSAYDPNAESQYGYDYDDPYVPYQPYVPQTLGEKLAYMPGEYWLIIAGVPLVIALVVCLMMKKQMRTAGIATRAAAYIPNGGVKLVVRQDIYTHTTTRVIHHERNDSHGGGRSSGGGFSGRSGKF